jgi:DNA-binding MarR family transcriptional regulator
MVKSPPPADPRGSAWLALLIAHATLLETIEKRLADAKLPPLAWYDVLWELEKAAGGRLRMHELAQRVVLSRSNLTRLADRLEAAGLIAREACADDRRGAYCVLSAPGRAMRRRMWPVYASEIEALWSSNLTRSEGRVIGEALRRIVDSARAARDDASARE